jgi:hypothetical protein
MNNLICRAKKEKSISLLAPFPKDNAHIYDLLVTGGICPVKQVTMMYIHFKKTEFYNINSIEFFL